MRNATIAMASAAFFLSISINANAYEPSHFDTRIDYQTCDGSKWSAVLNNNIFTHTSWQTNKSHQDDHLDFRTWDGGCASGYVDAGGFRVVFKGTTYANTSLNYTAADGSKYAAKRVQNGFYHVFVGRPDDKSTLGSFNLNDVVEFLGRNKEVISLVISYL